MRLHQTRGETLVEAITARDQQRAIALIREQNMSDHDPHLGVELPKKADAAR